MCDFDSSEDISTIENGGCVAPLIYVMEAQKKMWKQQKNNLESHGYHQDLASRWYKD